MAIFALGCVGFGEVDFGPPVVSIPDLAHTYMEPMETSHSNIVRRSAEIRISEGKVCKKLSYVKKYLMYLVIIASIQIVSICHSV